MVRLLLRLTCSACKFVSLKAIKRCKHFEIMDKGQKKKGLY